jgi:hypothetical protein
MLRSLSSTHIFFDASFVLAISRSLEELAGADLFNDASAKTNRAILITPSALPER